MLELEVSLAQKYVLGLLAVNSLPGRRCLRSRKALTATLWPDVAEEALRSLIKKGLVEEDGDDHHFQTTSAGRKVLYE